MPPKFNTEKLIQSADIMAHLTIKDPGILGSVGIAAYGSGIFSSINQAFEEMITFDKFYEPDQTKLNYYSDLFEIYKNLTESNIKISEKFSKLTE